MHQVCSNSCKIGLVHTQGHHMTWCDFSSYLHTTRFTRNPVAIPPSNLSILLIVIFTSNFYILIRKNGQQVGFIVIEKPNCLVRAWPEHNESHYRRLAFRSNTMPRKRALQVNNNLTGCFSHRFSTRSIRFMDAYRKGLDGKQAAWASKKYRGHCVLSDTIMADLAIARLAWTPAILLISNVRLHIYTT